MKRLLNIVILLSLGPFLAGCQTLEVAANMGAEIAAATGAISTQQATSIKKGAQAAGQAFEEFTPENEYYIGRTIAANILGKYKVYQNQEATRYVNLLGQTVALASDKPETFKGYHFLIMDTDEINAFATPGGFIFISRGLMRCCTSEDSLAAVLAHEVGHVQLGHGMAAIQGSRYTALGKVAGVELAKNLGSEQLAQAAEVFDGAIGDIMKKMIDNGYQSTQEYDADKAAVTIMKRMGYNPRALANMLEQMQKRLGPGSGGFGKTHPTPESRLRNIGSLLQGSGAVQTPETRKVRFNKVMVGL